MTPCLIVQILLLIHRLPTNSTLRCAYPRLLTKPLLKNAALHARACFLFLLEGLIRGGQFAFPFRILFGRRLHVNSIFITHLPFLTFTNPRAQQRRRRGQREPQHRNRFIKQKKEKFVRFLYISLPLLNDCDVKMLNFTYYGGCE